MILCTILGGTPKEFSLVQRGGTVSRKGAFAVVALKEEQFISNVIIVVAFLFLFCRVFPTVCLQMRDACSPHNEHRMHCTSESPQLRMKIHQLKALETGTFVFTCRKGRTTLY